MTLRTLAPTMATCFTLAAAMLAANPALAQGTLQSGSTFFQFVGTPMGTGTGNANLLFGSSSAFGTEQLYRYGWSYNQGPGTSNRALSSLDTPAASYVGNTATFTWTNAGAGTADFARFNAVMTVRLTEISPSPGGNVPGAARVDTTLSFTASSANLAPVAFSLFNEIDLDIQGSFGANGDTYRVLDASAGSGIRATAFDTSSSNYAEFLAVGAQRYQFATGTALRSSLGAGNPGSGNLGFLAGTVQPDWVSTDGAAAFQWTRTLAPGENFAVSSSFTINSPVPEPGSWALMGAGGLLLAGWLRRRRAA